MKNVWNQITHATCTQKVFSVLCFLIALSCLVQIFIMNTFHAPEKDVFQQELLQKDCPFPADDTSVQFTPETAKVEAVGIALASNSDDGSGRIELSIRDGEDVLFRGGKDCLLCPVEEWFIFSTNLTLNPSKTYTMELQIIDATNPESIRLSGVRFAKGDVEVIRPSILIRYAENLPLVDKLLLALYVVLLTA